MIEARHWQRLKPIVVNALEKESTAERIDLVRTSCAHDVELLQAAEYFLAKPEIFSRLGDDLEDCASSARLGTGGDDQEIGRHIGAYVILRQVGEGGMGLVYLAARSDGCFEKQVAIKFLRSDTRSEEPLRRFCVEREILARLDHPHIARLIDAGTTQEGVPYFIMEYVDGTPITDFVAKQSLPLPERLELFLKVAGAVQAAHERGIIHRDLKPSNIVVDQEGEPRLLDFGIAKLGNNSADPCWQTVSGRERLTPVFASPEQIRGESVTASTDVYSLGVVLYEMVTGSVPFRFESERPSIAELMSTVCEQAPIAPRDLVKDRCDFRQVRGDLNAILLRAIEKQPDDRYSSIAEFSEDIRRHMRAEPVRARSSNRFYLLGRTLLKKGRPNFFIGLILVFLLVGAFVLHRITGQSESPDFLAQRAVVEAWQLAAAASEPNSREPMLKAVRLLDETVKRDPSFFLAYSQLATVHLDLYWQGFDHSAERLALARRAIENLGRLKPDDVETHIARANYAYHGFRDYARAQSELELARKKSPDNATTYTFIAAIDRRQGRWSESIQNWSRGIELDPASFRYHEEQAFTYEALRKYEDARRAYERAREIVPYNYFLRAQLARIPFLERGDVQPLQTEISTILTEKPAAADDLSPVLFECALAERNAADIERALASIPLDGLRDTYTNSVSCHDWLVGLAARSLGDAEKARTSFKSARAIEEKAVRTQPDDPKAWGRLGLIDAGLGRTEDAIREGRHACELLPVSVDAWEGPALIVNLAIIYGWVGEKDLAIQQLKQVTSIPCHLSYGELKLSPKWDPLRGDPRFEKIVASLAPR